MQKNGAKIFTLALALNLLLSFLVSSLNAESYKIVCYFTNWAVNRPGYGSMTPEHIDPCLCTHLIYAFSGMRDHKLYPMDKLDHSDEGRPGFFERMNNLKQKNPKLRTLLAVGGWEMGMSAFTAMVRDNINIKIFVASTIAYLRKWNFDGLDLDFEYPGVDWRGSPAEDKMAFTKLCKMLREGFEMEAKESGKERLLLSAAVAGAKNTIDKAYEVDKVSEYIDWWNLMTYDLHGMWDNNAGHHSALNGKDSQDFLNINYVVKYYESKGAPRSKIVVGLANYGRSDSPAMPYTGFKGESGFLSYYETCLMISCENWKEYWNEAQLVPYAKGRENYPWAGYDNVKSMKIKAEYIAIEKLGGAMFWAVDLDDFTGKFCCQGYFPLIRTVKSVLENDPQIMPPTEVCRSCPNREYKTFPKNFRKKRSLASEYCKEKGEGTWADPLDCTKYFVCRSLTTSWAEKKHQSCWSGSYFDQTTNSCKWHGKSNFDCEDLKNPPEEKIPEQAFSKNIQNPISEAYSAQSDTIIPPEFYTCRADNSETSEEVEIHHVKCYSCEGTGKNIKKCKNFAENETNISWCSKNQKCFVKAQYNMAKKNELSSYSRGCAFLSDLDPAKGETVNADLRGSTMASSSQNSNCVIKQNSAIRVCYEVCDEDLCNTQNEPAIITTKKAEKAKKKNQKKKPCKKNKKKKNKFTRKKQSYNVKNQTSRPKKIFWI